MNERKINQKGITLVALVITVVIMIIIARNKCKCTYWRKWYIK